MPVKQYESKKYAKLSISLRIGGVNKRINFVGGTKAPKKRGGLFTTDSLAIQRAIEKRPDFKNKFRIMSESLTRAEQNIENQRILDGLKVPHLESGIPEPVLHPSSLAPKPVLEVTKFQEAKIYLFNKFSGEYILADLNSKAKVKTEAVKRNIVFPNWPAD